MKSKCKRFMSIGLLFMSVLFFSISSCKKDKDTPSEDQNDDNNNQPKPSVDFSFSPENPVTGETITFTSQTEEGSSEIQKWKWSFGDTNNSNKTDENPTFAYEDAGTFTVILIAIDKNEVADTVSKDITIESKLPFDGGEGTQAKPYLIAYPAQLESMHDSVDWSASTAANPFYFKLTKDLDMEGQDWTGLDPGSSQFINFDGDGHIIKNLKVNSGSYVSMFGVLVGTVKNLGLVDVDIESSSSGVGAFAGYVGFKGPDKATGLIENCFSTGKVSGPDAVGGIAGNVGKPNGSVTSTIKNCFSTVDLTATTESGNARAGGIVGINFAGGIVENCFSSGEIISKTIGANGAGGIAGWTDTDLQGDVALNKSISIGDNGIVGRISGSMGSVNGVIGQGENCLALEDIVLMQGTTQVPSSEYVTGQVTTRNGSYDGESKTKAYLGDMNNYSTIGWEVGTGKPWASTSNNSLPILQWLFERGDYAGFY